MIKYNLNTINDWNFGDDNIIKVYRNNAVCYYKITGGGDTPTAQTPCFAVVDDISQYSDTEFEDVYNQADDKWYKLNNLSEYEEYGVYGSGRTSCEGSASRLPQGYTEVEYIENTGTSTSNGAYLNLGLPLYDAIGNSFQITSRLKSEYYSASGYDDLETIINSEGVSSPYYGFVYRYAHSNHNIELASSPSNHATLSTTANTDGTTSITISCNSTTVTDQVPLGLFASYNANYNTPYRFAKATIYSFTVVKNGTTVRDLVPAKRDSDSVYGVYDLINDVFYTSPNGNNFSGGEPITPTVCVTTYEGKLTIDDGYEYMYSGGSWINVGEVSGSTATLPDVPFTVNFNAKNYNSSTKTLVKTNGQLANVDAVITAGTPTVNDGYLTIAASTRATIEGYQTYFNRTNSAPNITIISKLRTDGSNCHVFANRDSNYNWMYRPTSTKLNFHGSSQIEGTSVTTQPVIEGIRVDSNRLLRFNNYTDNTTSTSSSLNYGSTNSGKFALFAGYGSSSGEWFVGDFYWIYMSQTTLTDEQVQQVIDYNEGGGGQPIYPLEYVVREDPPDNLVFSSMTEAEAYECPWVGMKATIDGDNYIFSGDSISGYEWVVYNPPTFSGKWLATYSDSHTESAQCDSSSSITKNEINGTNLVSVEIGDCVTSIGDNAFDSFTSLTSIDIPNSVTTIGQLAFSNCTSLSSVIIGSGVTSIGNQAFINLSLNVTVLPTTPPTIFTNYLRPFTRTKVNIYVPSELVDIYKADSSWSYYASRIQAIPNS